MFFQFYLNNNELYRLDAKLLPWSKLRVFEFHNNPLDCSCDLYNITMSLSSDIRRDENGPYCRDSTNTESQKVADLTEDICLRKVKIVYNIPQYPNYFISECIQNTKRVYRVPFLNNENGVDYFKCCSYDDCFSRSCHWLSQI